MSVNANKAYAYGELLQNPSVARADGINRRDSPKHLSCICGLIRPYTAARPLVWQNVPYLVARHILAAVGGQLIQERRNFKVQKPAERLEVRPIGWPDQLAVHCPGGGP